METKMKDEAPVSRRELREALETVEAIAKGSAAAYMVLVSHLADAKLIDVPSLMVDLRQTEDDARKRNEMESVMKTLRSYRFGLADLFGLPDDPQEP